MDTTTTVPRKQFGHCDFTVPILSFGASGLGSVFREVTHDEAEESVQEALKHGVNLFDTSPFYGLGKSETALGHALRNTPRDAYLLATKVGRYGETTFDFSAQRTLESFAESTQRLGVHSVDILQAHDVEFARDATQVATETIPALMKLRDEGRVRAIGITGLPIRTLVELRQRLPPNTLDCVLSYCHFTMFDQTLVDEAPALAANGEALINAAPLAMGLLTRAGPPAWHPASAAIKRACARAVAAAGADVDAARLALRYAVRGAPACVCTTLVGMSSVDEVRRNVAAATDDATHADAAASDAMLRALTDVHNQTWPSGSSSSAPQRSNSTLNV